MEFVALLVVAAAVVGISRSLARQNATTDGLLMETVDAYRLGEGAEAEALYVRLIPELKTGRQVFRAAQMLMDARAFQASLNIVKIGLQRRPNDQRLVRLDALLRTQLLDPAGIDALKAWVADNPRDNEARFVLARVLLRLRRMEEMIRLLRLHVTVKDPTIEGYSLLGRACFHLKRLEDAREFLEEAMYLRGAQARSTIPMYDVGVIGGFDASVAVEGHWETERDRMLLDQIDERQRSLEARPDMN